MQSTSPRSLCCDIQMTFQSAKRTLCKRFGNTESRTFSKTESKTFSTKSICKVANVSANQRRGGNYVTSYCLQGYLHGNNNNNNNNNNNTFNLKGAFQDTQDHFTEHKVIINSLKQHIVEK